MDPVRDVGRVVRALARRPGFTALVVATLALGIGANTAIFSVVNAVLLRALPYPDADRLVEVSERVEGGSEGVPTSVATYRDWRNGAPSFEVLGAAAVFQSVVYTGGDEASRLRADLVTPTFLEALGARAAVGRLLLPEEGEGLTRAAPVAVLSHAVWQRVFGGDPGVVGRAVTLSGTPYTVVGVLEADFQDPLPAGFPVDVYLPVTELTRIVGPGSMLGRQTRRLIVVGRLRPGVGLERAQDELDAVMSGIRAAEPAAMERVEARVRPLRDRLLGELEAPLLALLAGAVFLLVVACVNVAGLVLARGDARVREVAVRRAVGASSSRIVRELLAEAMVLSALGGLAGLLVAGWMADLVLHFNREVLPPWVEVTLDPGVAAVAIVLSGLSGVVFGLLPVRRTVGGDLRRALAPGGRGGSRPCRPGRSALVVVEVAVATVLVVGSGLLLRSFQSLAGTDLGFRTERVASAMVTPPPEKYRSLEELDVFRTELVAALEARPEVEWAGIWAGVRPGQARQYRAVLAEGSEVESRFEAPLTRIHSVTPGLLEAMDIPLLAGRDFRASDREGAEPVVVLSEGLARTLFGEEDPLGRRVRDFGSAREGIAPSWRVVGVVGDTRLGGRSLPENLDVPHDLYFSPNQPSPVLQGYLVVLAGTRGEAGAAVPGIRSALRGVDPDVPAFALTPLSEAVAQELVTPRFVAVLMGAFGLLSLFLAALGIYGVLSQSVGARRREVALRRALGAPKAGTALRVVGEGMRLTLTGMLLGGAAVWGLARLAGSLLHGVPPHDPVTLAAGGAVLLVVALLAAWGPTLGALRVSPMAALREE